MKLGIVEKHSIVELRTAIFIATIVMEVPKRRTRLVQTSRRSDESSKSNTNQTSRTCDMHRHKIIIVTMSMYEG